MQQSTGAQDHRPTTPPSRWRIAGLLVLAAAAGVLAWASTIGLGAAPQPASARSSVTPATGIDVGLVAPEFTGADARPLLRNLDGNPVSLAAYRGRPVWVVFWATWCVPCQEEAGGIRDAFHAHADEGLAVLAIDVQEPADAVRSFAAANDLDYDIGLDFTAAVKDLYGGWGLPAHFFLDSTGVIRDRYLGQLTRELMEQRLAAILPAG